jgi:hypothetical protein
LKTDEVTKILENAVDSGDLNTVKKYIDVPCKNDLKNAVKEVSDKYENNTNIKQHNLGDIDFEYNDNIFELKAPYDDAHSVVSKAVTKQDNDGYQEYINFINNLEKKNKFQIIIYLLSHFW